MTTDEAGGLLRGDGSAVSLGDLEAIRHEARQTAETVAVEGWAAAAAVQPPAADVHPLAALEARRHHDEILQFQEALTLSQQINVAIGIVMAREGLDRDGALAVLIEAARDHDSELRDVAAAVEDVGRLPF